MAFQLRKWTRNLGICSLTEWVSVDLSIGNEVGKLRQRRSMMLGILCGLEGAGKHAGYLIGCDSGVASAFGDHRFAHFIGNGISMTLIVKSSIMISCA